MPRTVIIAVNDPNIRYLLQRYTEESGLVPVSPSPGHDVLDLLIHLPRPALLILDVDFPAAGSLQSDREYPPTAGGVRSTAAEHNIPTVLYSYLDEPADEALEGVAACLYRSVLYDDFVGALGRAGIELQSARHV